MSRPTPEQLRFILECAISAPSADNRHLFTFEVDSTGVSARYTGGELPAAGRYRRALFLMSMGAVAENLKLAATRYGFAVEPVLFPDAGQARLIFRAGWEDGGRDEERLWSVIASRHTNRRLRYRGPVLSSDELLQLGSEVEVLRGCRLHFLDDSRARRRALRMVRVAEGERFRNRTLHAELFSAVRFDVGWRRSCDDGLPAGALEIEKPLQSAFALLRHWRLVRILNIVGADRLLGWRAGDLPCRFAPHLAVISVEQSGDRATFSVGRALERVWLMATRSNIALQPMAASVLYALDGACEEGIPDALNKSLKRGWEEIVPDRCPLILFRMGRAPSPTVTSSRQPVQHYWSSG